MVEIFMAIENIKQKFVINMETVVKSINKIIV